MLTKTGASLEQGEAQAPNIPAGRRRITDVLWREKYPVKGITSEEVVRLMKAKYNIDPQIIATDNPGLVPRSNFTQDQNGRRRAKLIKKLSRPSWSSIPNKRNTAGRRALREQLQQGEGDFITVDARLLKENPAIVGYELGQASNLTGSGAGANIARLGRSRLANLAIQAGTLAGMIAGNPAVTNAGFTAGALRSGADYAGTRHATRKADQALTELGHEPRSRVLQRKNLARMPELLAASLAVGSV